MPSLKGRLSAGLAASLVLLLGVQWWAASWAIERLTTEQLLSRMAHDAESLLAGAHFDPEGTLALDPARINAVYQRPFSGHYYVVAAGAQIVASRSLWDATLPGVVLEPGQVDVRNVEGPQRQPLLLRTAGYRKQERALSISVAEDLAPLRAGLRRFQVIYGVLSATVLAALLLVQRLIVSRGLAPIEAVRENLARLERGEAARIDAAAPAEIEPMIAELNRLLATLDKRSRRSREALGNLAHALKTRLAILNQAADAPELADRPALRDTLRESTEAMRRIVERELKRARLAGSAMPGQRVDLEAEIAVLARTLGMLYGDKSPVIDWEVAPGTQFVGDREDLLELLGNLLDNACKWARSRVDLRITEQSQLLLIQVEDDGPGIAEGRETEALSRGMRLDEQTPGHGLGLAIVSDIVAAYHGELVLGRAGLGGLGVGIRLPLATEVPDART